jgi:hypothetical protein
MENQSTSSGPYHPYLYWYIGEGRVPGWLCQRETLLTQHQGV